jgi:hypothetical protein
MKILFSPSDDSPLLPCPACEHCGQRTRLVGIEPHPRFAGIDLRTFVCNSCDAMQTQDVALNS